MFTKKISKNYLYAVGIRNRELQLWIACLPTTPPYILAATVAAAELKVVFNRSHVLKFCDG